MSGTTRVLPLGLIGNNLIEAPVKGRLLLGSFRQRACLL